MGTLLQIAWCKSDGNNKLRFIRFAGFAAIGMSLLMFTRILSFDTSAIENIMSKGKEQLVAEGKERLPEGNALLPEQKDPLPVGKDLLSEGKNPHTRYGTGVPSEPSLTDTLSLLGEEAHESPKANMIGESLGYVKTVSAISSIPFLSILPTWLLLVGYQKCCCCCG